MPRPGDVTAAIGFAEPVSPEENYKTNSANVRVINNLAFPLGPDSLADASSRLLSPL
jgi:hypothetical protein